MLQSGRRFQMTSLISHFSLMAMATADDDINMLAYLQAERERAPTFSEDKMKKPPRRHHLLEAATAALLVVIIHTTCVDARDSVVASTKNFHSIINNNNARRDPLGRIVLSTGPLSSISRHRTLLPSGDENTSIISTLQRLRGGSEEEDDDDGNNISSEEEKIDASLVEDDTEVNNSNKKEGSLWASLFGIKSSDNKSSDAPSSSSDDDDNESGSFEITMNTTPDGKSNVKVDIETPKSIQKEVKETLNQMENNSKIATTKTQPNNKGGSVAHQVSAGGATSTTSSKTPSGGTGGHISAKFPISKSELPHFFSMSFMMFLFIYVFTTVRDTKDTLVVSNCGAEAIPFLKLYAVMPCATAFIVIYSKLSNVLGKQALFYVTLIPFFIFYGIFAFVLFPMRDVIHFPLAEGAIGAGGALGKAMNLLRYWSFSLFFVVSELWASAGVPLLFWSVSVFDIIYYMHYLFVNLRTQRIILCLQISQVCQ